MNKKVGLYLLILISYGLGSSGLMAEECLNTTTLRAGAFFPTNSKFRQIYGDVGVSLQLEETRTWRDCPNLELWANAEWIFMDGAPKGRCGTTDIDILNLSFGLRGIREVYCNLFLYAGIGPNVGIVFVENRIQCCAACEKYKENLTRAGIGGIVKTGGQYYFTSHFYLDLFAEYLYLPIHFNNTLNMGGFKVGAGLGARF